MMSRHILPPIRVGLLVAWTALILYGTLKTSPFSSGAGGWIGAWGRRLGIPEAVQADAFHFVAYAVWAWFLAGVIAVGYLRPFARRHLAICIGLLIVMSATQEALQFLNPTRTSSVGDFALNVVGGGLCLLARGVVLPKGTARRKA